MTTDKRPFAQPLNQRQEHSPATPIDGCATERGDAAPAHRRMRSVSPGIDRPKLMRLLSALNPLAAAEEAGRRLGGGEPLFGATMSRGPTTFAAGDYNSSSYPPCPAVTSSSSASHDRFIEIEVSVPDTSGFASGKAAPGTPAAAAGHSGLSDQSGRFYRVAQALQPVEIQMLGVHDPVHLLGLMGRIRLRQAGCGSGEDFLSPASQRLARLMMLQYPKLALLLDPGATTTARIVLAAADDGSSSVVDFDPASFAVVFDSRRIDRACDVLWARLEASDLNASIAEVGDAPSAVQLQLDALDRGVLTYVCKLESVACLSPADLESAMSGARQRGMHAEQVQLLRDAVVHVETLKIQAVARWKAKMTSGATIAPGLPRA